MKGSKIILNIFIVSILVLSTMPLNAQESVSADISGQPQNVRSEDELIPNDPAVRIGKLPNGLTYYIRKNVEPRNRAVLYMAVKVGSLMETDSQQGLAHFTEHMAFNGTRDFPRNELIGYLQKAGVKFGADLNAYTSYSETVYELPIPTNDKNLFHNGFKILANWAGYVSMDNDQIDAERGVIIEEERQRGKNAESRLQHQFSPFVLQGSRYAERDPIGKVYILEHFKYNEIKQFYKDWYRPELQTVIAVGDFDVEEVEKMIKENFSPLKNPVNPRQLLDYTIPYNKEPMIKIATDPEYPYHVTFVMIKRPGNITKTAADVKKQQMIRMINTMMNNRLEELKKKAAVSFFKAEFSYGKYYHEEDPRMDALFLVAASVSPFDLSKSLDEVATEVQRMKRFGFTLSELSTVKKYMEADNERSYLERDKTASTSFVAQYLNNFLTGEAMPDIVYRYQLNKRLLAEISISDVNTVAANMVDSENVVVAVQAPEKSKENLPTEKQLLSTIKNAGKNVTAYIDNSVHRPLLERKPIAGKLISERKIKSIGVTELILSNKIKIILKPTVFKNDEIRFYSFGRGGTSLANDDSILSARVSDFIYGSGIGDFDNIQLRKVLAGSTAHVSPYIDQLYQGYNGSSAPKDIETALQLVYAYTTNPRNDPAYFRRMMEEAKVLWIGWETNPLEVFADTVNAVMASYNKRGRSAAAADVDQISFQQAFDFYKDRFANSAEQTFIFVGNFDIDKLKPLLETYLGSLPSLSYGENFINRGVKPLSGKVSKKVVKGIEDKAKVQLFFHGDYEFNTESNIQLKALNSILAVKMNERLREKEGGVYSPSVTISLEQQPTPYYKILISFFCAKSNVDKLINAANDEVGKIIKAGATSLDIDKFKAEQSRAIEVNLRDNSFWLSTLVRSYTNGEDPTNVLLEKEDLKRVTTQSTKMAAQKYLNGSNYFKAVLVSEL